MNWENHEEKIRLLCLSSETRIVVIIFFFVIIVLGIAGCVFSYKYTPILPSGDSRYNLNNETALFQEDSILIKISARFASPGIHHSTPIFISQ